MKQAEEDHEWMHCPICDLLLPFDTDPKNANLHLIECAKKHLKQYNNTHKET